MTLFEIDHFTILEIIQNTLNDMEQENGYG